jgi:hypothetical protein
VPFKGKLSNSTRAIEQRTRAALRNKEATAVERAKDSDRATRYQLKKRLKKDPKYIKASLIQQEKRLTKEEEKLTNRRFQDNKSSKLSQFFITYLYLRYTAE